MTTDTMTIEGVTDDELNTALQRVSEKLDPADQQDVNAMLIAAVLRLNNRLVALEGKSDG